MLNDVEFYGLCQRSALADGHDVTLTNIEEGRRAVNRNILVSLGETSIFRHILQVISANNKSSLHFVGDDQSLQDASTNRHVSGERALLVNIRTSDGFLWCLEAQSNALVVSGALRVIFS